MKKIIIPILIIAIIIGITALYINNKQNSVTSTTNLSPIDSSGNKDVVQYAIDMDNYSFSPNIIKAQPGTDLRIKITNKNGIHNLKIDKLNYESEMFYSGDSKIITIKIPSDASGEYEFYCGFSNHKAMGMTGKLQVGNI